MILNLSKVKDFLLKRQKGPLVLYKNIIFDSETNIICYDNTKLQKRGKKRKPPWG
jgi:hypothetical protein